MRSFWLAYAVCTTSFPFPLMLDRVHYVAIG